MMPNPVSIIPWRNTKTDPPESLPDRPVLAQRANGATAPTFSWLVAADSTRLFTLWAEIPVVSDLTDEDVRDVADLAEGFLTRAGINPKSSAHEDIARLRAALAGEKGGL